MGHSSINISLTYLRGLEIPELKEEDMPMVQSPKINEATIIEMIMKTVRIRKILISFFKEEFITTIANEEKTEPYLIN